MGILRHQGRPKRGELAVGRDRIIAETLDLLRRGVTFSSRKELASKIGITPALLNYYFGRNCDLVRDPIMTLVKDHAERFHRHIARQKGYGREELTEALLIICRMYIEDGPLLSRYADFVAADLVECSIAQMSRDLAHILTTMSEEVKAHSSMASTMTAMLWAVCANAKDEECVATCVALVDRMIGVQLKSDIEGVSDPPGLTNKCGAVLAHYLSVCDASLDYDPKPVECPSKLSLI